MHDLFQADILRQHQAFTFPTAGEDAPNTPDELIEVQEDPEEVTRPEATITRPLATDETPVENKRQDQLGVRRSARISAKASQACIMLLAMTPEQTPNTREK